MKLFGKPVPLGTLFQRTSPSPDAYIFVALVDICSHRVAASTGWDSTVAAIVAACWFIDSSRSDSRLSFMCTVKIDRLDTDPNTANLGASCRPFAYPPESVPGQGLSREDRTRIRRHADLRNVTLSSITRIRAAAPNNLDACRRGGRRG